ncbi:cytidine/deoxycytidylate deaminase-like protein [Rhizobium sp. BK251]|nr:cytidine/deoxycytidylate deaminase-like protein [Rhizobium sp. BK251]
MAGSKRSYDEALLRKAFDVARRSREGGDHPFGSLLADRDGNVLLEQRNGYSSEGGDRTAHAERLLATRAGKAYGLDFLAECTMYTSAEPCAMRHVLGRDLLGRHRARRLWPLRERDEAADRR